MLDNVAQAEYTATVEGFVSLRAPIIAMLAALAAAAAALAQTPTPTPVPGLPAPFTPPTTTAPVGWSCGDFPCADATDEWLRRLQVPPGFEVRPVGRFPGQVNQIALSPAGELHATVLENGTRQGAVWAMDATGDVRRVSQSLQLPFGIAFQPGSGALFVSGRTTPLAGGSVWLILPDGTPVALADNLPCCYNEIDNQPNGLLFGADGALYVGVGSTTDHGESANPLAQAWAVPQPLEAAIVRFDPQTGAVEPFATGIRNPIDMAQDAQGRLLTTDSGLVSGIGNRLIAVTSGTDYGFPYYRSRGCEECPPSRGSNFAPPDLLAFPLYSLPRGLALYTGDAFPEALRNTLFVAIWNAPYQMIAWVNPNDPALLAQPGLAYPLTPFMTGLLRPSDVIVTPQGSLLVSDWLHGHIWEVVYTGEAALPTPTQAAGFVLPTLAAPPSATPTPASFFVTNTPAP
jgi:glucose/arabinose dehydrogenase